MSGIQTGIELNDDFTGIIYGIINSVGMAVSAMDDMAQGMNAGIDTSSLEGAREEINQATADLNELHDSINRQMEPDIARPVVDTGNQQPVSVPVIPTLPEPLVENPEPVELPVQPNAPPKPVQIPVVWETDGLDVFQGTGIERFQQEVRSADAMLEQLSATQNTIAAQARSTYVLPPEAFQDLNRLATRVDHVRERIQLIENNPVNIGTDTANAELAQLRAQLNQSLQAQNNLNDAMQRMDVSAANTAYINLSRSVSTTEQHIRDNVDEQGRFNQRVQEGIQHSNGLTRGIRGAVGAYLTLQSLGKIIGLSDSMTQTEARLNLIVDDGGSVEELQNKIHASAQDSRESYEATAAAVSKLGMQAGKAFSGNDELIGFTELLNKQFVNAGTSAQGIDSVMLQLTQSMAAGKLQGEELNAVLDNASPIVQNIQKYMEEVQGIDASNIKQLAADGELTAEVIKNAMFYAAADINQAFETMPMTWSQQWNLMKNDALIAFQPVLQRINDIANSEAVRAFVENFKGGMTVLANVVLNIFDMIGAIGGFIADNWSIISPIIYGIITALAVYYGWLLLAKGAVLLAAGAQNVLMLAKRLSLPIYAALTGQTIANTAAQWGLNSALLACPLVWIIITIIALIAIFYAVIAAINHFAGTSISATGVICGVFMTALAFIGNLFISLYNAVVDVFVLIYNLIATVANFIGNVFTDPVGAVARLFFGLADTVLGVLQTLASAIDTIFGSNLSGAVQGWRDSLGGWVDEKFGAGVEIMAQMSGEDLKLNRFDYGTAYDKGNNFGKGIDDSISKFNLSDLFGMTDVPNADDYKTDTSGMGSTNVTPATGTGGNSGTAKNLDNIAADTDRISRSVDIANEDLKYLRDIAARSVVNRFTTAKIKVEMTNHNKINSDLDLDGIMNNLTNSVSNAMSKTAEGVHA